MKKELMSSGVNNTQRKRIYRRENFMCALCGGDDGMQIHHVVPRAKGGTNLDENLICLCRFCHSLAHGVMLRDYCDMDTVGIEDMMAEYLADYYINIGFIWNPWGNGRYEPYGEMNEFIERELELHPNAKIITNSNGAIGIEIPDDEIPF